MGTSHRFALFGATFARVGATLTMIHVVLSAFLTALAAYLRAQPAKLLRELRVTRHELCCQHTNVRAIPIQADAPFHHFHVVLLQAGRRAMFTFLRALQARLNTFSIFFVSHNFSFLRKDQPLRSSFNPRVLVQPRLPRLLGSFSAVLRKSDLYTFSP